MAAEQGLIGLAAYGWLLLTAFALIFGGLKRTLRRRPATVVLVGRCVVAAAFCALLLHTLVYAAFLEDPLTWTLLAIAAALRHVELSTTLEGSDPSSEGRGSARLGSDLTGFYPSDRASSVLRDRGGRRDRPPRRGRRGGRVPRLPPAGGEAAGSALRR